MNKAVDKCWTRRASSASMESMKHYCERCGAPARMRVNKFHYSHVDGEIEGAFWKLECVKHPILHRGQRIYKKVPEVKV